VRTTTIATIALGAALALAGCGDNSYGGGSGGSSDQSAASGSGGGGKALTVDLATQNGSGETGTATLTPMGSRTKVALDVSGGPMAAQPAHIHKGTCAKLDPTPAYPLQNVAEGKSVTTVNVALPDLKKGSFAINVHKSETDLATYVACGNIGSGGSGSSSGGGYGY